MKRFYLQRILRIILAPLLFTCLSLNHLHAQPEKPVRAWKQFLAANDTLAPMQPDIISNEEYFLIQCKPGYISALRSNPDVIVARQLDDSVFIVRSNATSLNNNRSLFTFISPANDLWKLSPGLLRILAGKNGKSKQVFLATVHDMDAFRKEIRSMFSDRQLKIIQEIPHIKTWRIETSFETMQGVLMKSAQVIFIESSRSPFEEAPIAAFDNRLNTINKVHADQPDINGAGLVVSVKENLFDTSDIDLVGRITKTDSSSAIVSSHATQTATVIAGAGNSFYTGLGAVPRATVISNDFKNLLPDMDAYAKYNISVQNHSYGVGIENYYGSDALAYDTSMLVYPGLIHVFSSGNIGNEASVDGRYSGIPGFANLTGSFKMSKNTLTIGSVNPWNEVAPLSSKGPAYDGRIKPELVAYGASGSSEAAATVSGIALLLQDTYARNHSGQLPDNALVKCMLINSATDVENPGPDYLSGYGSVNASRAVQQMFDETYLNGTISGGEKKVFALNIPPNAVNLKVTLTWNDLPAKPNAFRSLVNDLDLVVTHQNSGSRWNPWVLSGYAHIDSLNATAGRKRDSINVVEQVTIENPPGGAYEISVTVSHISNAQQEFYISYQWDTISHFTWTYPSTGDYAHSNDENILRWRHTYADKTGRLEYSMNDGASWTPAADQINLNNTYYVWNAPDTIAAARVRMIIGGNVYSSGLFTISSPLVLNVGFDCADSLLLTWNRRQEADEYALYNLDGKYLFRTAIIKDTSIVAIKRDYTSSYFTIAPIINGAEAMKSYTINASLQGVGCYVKNFLADIQPDFSVRLTLELGTSHQVTRITFEKFSAGTWQPVHTQPAGAAVSHTTTDKKAADGILQYRAKVELQNGTTLYTQIVSVYKIQHNPVIVFPNPLLRGQSLQILSQSVPRSYEAVLFDVTGRKVIEFKITDIVESIPLHAISTGIYILVIQDHGKVIHKRKLLIR